jgi:hypothetical protein
VDDGRGGPEAEVREGNDRLFDGVVMTSAAVAGIVGSAPNRLSGIAVPTPVLVQGLGTGRREVTGLAWGVSE